MNRLNKTESAVFISTIGAIVIASLHLSARPSIHQSVCPLCYLLLNHWTKFNQIGVRVTHMYGACNVKLFCPATWDPGEGQKVKYHLISISKSISKIFLYQTLCVFSQMRDIKHIRQDFYSVAWVMTQGWDFGALGCPGGQKHFFQTWSCGISNRWG